MQSDEASYPAWPPGIWRRIVLQPGPGWIGGALEDDVHRFHMRIDHAGGRITAVRAEALRHPWSACPGATSHIASELAGELLSDTARRDPLQHCTHLYDLAVVLAAHTEDTAPRQFDLKVADRIGERTAAMLLEDGIEQMHWQIEGTSITGPAPYAGLNLKQLSHWKQELPLPIAEQATMLRRAVFISGARQFDPPPGLKAIDQGPQRMGACYNYQMPQAGKSTRTPDWLRDFSDGDEPLAGFEAVKAFAAMV